MAEIEWKGAIWRAAYGELSVKELLTILKGFGPMEILEFERPGHYWGQISLSLSKENKKEITIYHLEVMGSRRGGKGRDALLWLKKIFKGDLYVEDPGVIRVKNANQESLRFWVKMFREGHIEALDSEICTLGSQTSEVDISRIEEGLGKAVKDDERASSDK